VRPGLLRRAIELGSVVLLRAQAKGLGRGRQSVEVIATRSSFTLVRLDVKGSRNRLIIDPGARLRGGRTTSVETSARSLAICGPKAVGAR
jgi:hypothetical protein